MRKFWVLVSFSCLFVSNAIHAQQKIMLDKIVAVIGNDIIKTSDIQYLYMQMQLENMPVDEKTKCKIIEDVVLQKLLLDQAKLDSLNVTENQINAELDGRIKTLTEQIGTEQKLETFYGKTITEIKTEWYDLIKDQIFATQMQGKIVNDIQVSPNEVSSFYKNLPKDSIPEVNPSYEIAQIVVKSPIELKQKLEVKSQLEDLRQRILKGENFSKLAALYSEDLSSAKKGGDLGFVSRTDLVPEFAAVAFKLKEGELSRIVETDYGYHIIYMVEKKGDKANLKHILIAPKVSKELFVKCKQRADSIYYLLKHDSVTFEKAALLYSDDARTRNNGGLTQNPFTGNSKFDAKQIDPTTFFILKDLKVNEFSEPFLTQDETGKQVYSIVKLVSKTEAHKATLVDDYQLIKDLALQGKKKKALEDWFNSKISKTYISLDKDFSGCNFSYKGLIK